jgi:hypothetical protein
VTSQTVGGETKGGPMMCINPSNPIELGILLIVVGLAFVGLVRAEGRAEPRLLSKGRCEGRTGDRPESLTKGTGFQAVRIEGGGEVGRGK